MAVRLHKTAPHKSLSLRLPADTKLCFTRVCLNRFCSSNRYQYSLSGYIGLLGSGVTGMCLVEDCRGAKLMSVSRSVTAPDWEFRASNRPYQLP